jgi:hypothetical protein
MKTKTKPKTKQFVEIVERLKTDRQELVSNSEPNGEYFAVKWAQEEAPRYEIRYIGENATLPTNYDGDALDLLQGWGFDIYPDHLDCPEYRQRFTKAFIFKIVEIWKAIKSKI